MSANIANSRSYPLGSVVYPAGVNFSVYSKSASAMELLLFDNADDAKPSRVIRLDPKTNSTYHYWHVFVPGIGHGQIYAYRAYGPSEHSKGFRFDPEKVLLDPYAKAVAVPEVYDRLKASLPGDNCATAMKNIVMDLRGYDWQDDMPLKRPFS